MAGKPMLAYTIEASQQSKYISRTFVSTEDPEIKQIAISYGAEVIDRPQRYASDNNYELLGIFQQFKEYLWDIGYVPDFLAFLYPTSPLRTARQIDEAYELMIEKNCNRVYSAYKTHEGVFKERWVINDKGRAEHEEEHTQEEKHLRGLKQKFTKDIYIHTNDVLIMRLEEALPYTSIDYGDLALYEIDKNEVVDVNNEKEFEMAEMILERRMKGGDKKMWGGAIKPPTVITKYCPHCGAKNETMSEYTSDNTAGFIYCIKCGYQI